MLGGGLQPTTSLRGPTLKIDLIEKRSLLSEADRSSSRMFWAFRSCTRSYKVIEGGGGGEGFIDVDGTPLAGKYLGTLIMVCACDIKSHIFPIA